MMARAEMIKLINACPSRIFRDELDHHMSLEGRDYSFDEVSALMDIEDRAEDWKQAGLLKACRALLIAIGFYRVMPEEEIARTWVSRGKPWAFKIDGVAYITDHTSSQWFDTDFEPGLEMGEAA